jgi:rod shape-determining protein MreC
MTALNQEPPAFFHRGPSAGARLAFFGLLSLALLFADNRFKYLETTRHTLVAALYPLQRFAVLPRGATAQIGEYFRSLKDLQTDNARLQQQLLAQAPAVQAYVSLERENATLRQLMKIERERSGQTVLAEMLYGPRDPFRQKIIVDKGEDAQIKPGQAVIDQLGVIGQVTRVYPWMSEVTLITDKEQTTPVRVRRSGVRSVLYGAGAGQPLELRFMAGNADVQPGDVLVTSGIDGTYPPDLAVALVTAVERETGSLFARIQCQPAAGVDRSRQVLVVAPPAPIAARPDAPAETSAARAPGSGKRR